MKNVELTKHLSFLWTGRGCTCSQKSLFVYSRINPAGRGSRTGPGDKSWVQVLLSSSCSAQEHPRAQLCAGILHPAVPGVWMGSRTKFSSQAGQEFPSPQNTALEPQGPKLSAKQPRNIWVWFSFAPNLCCRILGLIERKRTNHLLF